MALLALGFVVVAFVNPGFYGPDWADTGAAKFGSVYGNYVARNFATGLITLYVVVRPSVATLIIALWLRIVTDLSDGVGLLIGGMMNMEYIISAIILVGGSGVAIFALNRLPKHNKLPELA